MAQEDLEPATLQASEASPSVSAVRGEDEERNELPHKIPAVKPSSTHESAVSGSSADVPPLTTEPQKTQNTLQSSPSGSDVRPAPSQSEAPQPQPGEYDGPAAQLVYNNHVTLDDVSGMEIDSQGSDSDSALGYSISGSSTTSLRASIYEFIEENGRTYHSYNSGKYLLPNDAAEQDRLDLQHHLFLLSLGSLHLAPISETPHNVLDIGTGTGIWAIDFAQQYPTAEVLGTDLSPIQPDYVPPNCFFQVSDFEDEWRYSQKFDYVHGRALTATMKDPRKILVSSFGVLRPGGWLELQDPTMPLLCIDDTMEGTALQEWMKLICVAGEKLGRSWLNSRNYKGWMEEIGFVNIKEEHFPWALSPWPKGKKQKLVALWTQQDLLDAIQGFSLGLLTRAFGWTAGQVEVLLVGVRKDIKNRNVHAYVDTLIVYGQKPGATNASL